MLDPFQRLPDELLLLLCEHMPPHAIWRHQRVSKTWQKLLSSDAAIRISLVNQESHNDEDSATISRELSQDARIDLMKAHYLGRPCETYQMRINNVSDMDRFLSAVLGSHWYVRPGSSIDVSVVNLCTNQQKIIQLGHSSPLKQLAISGSRLACLSRSYLQLWQLGDQHSMVWQKELEGFDAIAMQGDTIVVLRISVELQVWLTDDLRLLARLPNQGDHLHAVHLEGDLCYVFSWRCLNETNEEESGQYRLTVTKISLATGERTRRTYSYVQTFLSDLPHTRIERMEVHRTGRAGEVHVIIAYGYFQQYTHSIWLSDTHFGVFGRDCFNYIVWKGKLYRPQDRKIMLGDSFPTFSCESLPGMPSLTSYIVRETSLNKPSWQMMSTLINESFLVHYDWQNPRAFSVHAFQKGLITRDHHKVHVFTQESIKKHVHPRIDCGWVKADQPEENLFQLWSTGETKTTSDQGVVFKIEESPLNSVKRNDAS